MIFPDIHHPFEVHRGGSLTDLIDAMRWAGGLTVPGVPENLTPAKLLNISLVVERTCSAALQSAVDELSARGVVIVTAARCNNDIRIALLNRRGQHAFSWLSRCATSCRELQHGHIAGIPPFFTSGDSEDCFMNKVHSFEGEVAWHFHKGTSRAV